MLQLEKVLNGWIVTQVIEGEPEEKWTFEAYDMGSEDIDGTLSELTAFLRLLEVINDVIGPGTTKHSSNRLHIDIQKNEEEDNVSAENETISPSRNDFRKDLAETILGLISGDGDRKV